MDNKASLKGAWLHHVTLFKFWKPHRYISRMAEAKAVRFYTKGDCIKSCQIDDKSPLKGFWSRDPFLYAQLWTLKNSPRHSVN